jgi:hypothetical protein
VNPRMGEVITVKMKAAKTKGRLRPAANPAGLPRRSGAAPHATGKGTPIQAGGGKASVGHVAPGVMK